ncbi:diphthine synthase [Halobaculum sp. MBLA0147]|uniref:diphthine synthase n=1 Tax=Halobaculum sp. MBLA0147 TaxID=3079934 RepID=UPI00352360F5
MLTFVGLGLYDERSITVEGRDRLREADRVFAETYTSRLVGATLDEVADAHGVEIETRDRAGVERDPEPILAAAESDDVVFCTPGDPLIATTHTDLRLRAEDRGIDTHVVHGVTAAAAVASLTGLQNYRFGRSVTLPFPYAHGADGVPDSVVEGIEDNRERGLHTLVFLDIKAAGSSPAGPDGDQFMTADTAAGLLVDDWNADTLAVAVARAGGPDPVVVADTLAGLADREFGPPLHALVVPGDLHAVEADALRTLADAPADAVARRER